MKRTAYAAGMPDRKRAAVIRRNMRRSGYTGSFNPALYARRTYPGSRVPAASRGYRPNVHERKVIDIDRANYDINNVGTITLLNLCAAGTDMTNRIGRKIAVKSVYIRGHVKAQQSDQFPPASSPAQQFRFILFWDSQPNGATPAATDILKQATPESQLNLNYRDRFKILKDKTWCTQNMYINNTAANIQFGVAGPQIFPFKCYKKLNLETIYNAATGASIADIATGALFMLWIGNTSNSVVDGIASVTSRVRFNDL